MASSTPLPLGAEMDYSGHSGDDYPDGPREGLDAGELPPISPVYTNTIKPAQWAEMSPALRDSFVANAPNTGRKVHELDAEALVQQRKLEDDEAWNTFGRPPPAR